MWCNGEGNSFCTSHTLLCFNDAKVKLYFLSYTKVNLYFLKLYQSKTKISTLLLKCFPKLSL